MSWQTVLVLIPFIVVGLWFLYVVAYYRGRQVRDKELFEAARRRQPVFVEPDVAEPEYPSWGYFEDNMYVLVPHTVAFYTRCREHAMPPDTRLDWWLPRD